MKKAISFTVTAIVTTTPIIATTVLKTRNLTTRLKTLLNPLEKISYEALVDMQSGRQSSERTKASPRALYSKTTRVAHTKHKVSKQI